MTFFFPKSLLSISVFYRYFRKSSLFPRVILVNAYHYGIFKLTVSLTGLDGRHLGGNAHLLQKQE